MTEDVAKKIMQEAENNDGIIRTSQIEEIGIPRRNIRQLLDTGVLVKESKGLYSVAEISPDEYTVLQSRSEKSIFSYGTALFFHGLSDRVPHTIDVTVPQRVFWRWQKGYCRPYESNQCYHTGGAYSRICQIPKYRKGKTLQKTSEAL